MKETGQHFIGPYLPLPMPVMLRASDQTKQLHQTYLNAFNPPKASLHQNTATTNIYGQAPLITYRPVAPSQQVTVAPRPAPLHPSVHHSAAATGQATTATNHPATISHQPVPPRKQATPTHHPAPPNLRAGYPALPFIGAPPAPKSVDEPPPLHVPNFLLGFDNVPNHDAHDAVVPSFVREFDNLPFECSPPLTSKSFDELHRLLGSDLPKLKPSPFDLNRNLSSGDDAGLNPNGGSNAARDNNETNSAFGLQVSADLYATFAQQSAHAVSQHSAYCRMDGTCEKIEGNHVWAEQTSPALAEMFSSLAAKKAISHATNHVLILPKPPQTFSARSNIVSGSEWSSEDGSSSMRGSYRSSSEENTLNDSDSISDQEPPRKKTKANVDREKC
jgi:hypothetical protein